MMRALVGKYSASVVTLQLVLKSTSGGGQQAQLEADGIVIDPERLGRDNQYRHRPDFDVCQHDERR